MASKDTTEEAAFNMDDDYTELEKEHMKLRKQNQAFETLLPLLLPAKNKPKNLQNEKNNVEQADGCSPLPDKLQDENDLRTRTYATLEEEYKILHKKNQDFRNLLHYLLTPKNLQDEKNNAEQAVGSSPLRDKLQAARNIDERGEEKSNHVESIAHLKNQIETLKEENAKLHNEIEQLYNEMKQRNDENNEVEVDNPTLMDKPQNASPNCLNDGKGTDREERKRYESTDAHTTITLPNEQVTHWMKKPVEHAEQTSAKEEGSLDKPERSKQENEQLRSQLCKEQNKAKQVENSSKRNRWCKLKQWFKPQVKDRTKAPVEPDCPSSCAQQCFFGLPGLRHDICPTKGRRYINLNGAIAQVKTKKSRDKKEWEKWKSVFDEITSEIQAESQGIHCRKFLPFLEKEKIIEVLHEDKCIKEPKSVNFLNALKKGQEKLRKNNRDFALLVYVHTQKGRPDNIHCVQMLLKPIECSENDLVEGMHFFDSQIQETMTLTDFPVECLKRVQVVEILTENFEELQQKCGKHLCR